MLAYNRSIEINKETISYKLRYSKKARYLRLQIIRGNELEVILPRGCEISEAEKFIIKKAKWIKKHLKEKKKEVEKFLLFGREILVNQEFELFIKKHKINFENNTLKIVSPSGSIAKIKTIYEIWLKHQAKIYLINRAVELAGALDFSINKVSIKGQKTRWGSCSSKKNLSFNFKLMQYMKEIIDYVIIHELCHLQEMNHSKKFWLLVEKYVPDYKALRKELNHGKAI